MDETRMTTGEAGSPLASCYRLFGPSALSVHVEALITHKQT